MSRESRVGVRHSLVRLRADIAAIERRDAPRPVLAAPVLDGAAPERIGDVVPTGVHAFDNMIGGGLPTVGLSEFFCRQMRDTGALTGFAAAVLLGCRKPQTQPVMWISTGDVCREAGVLYGRGLASLGFAVSGLISIHVRTMADALWVAEEAARTRQLAGIVFDMRGNHGAFGLKQSRRLHMRARASGTMIVVLRQAAHAESSAAPLRLCVSPAPSLPDDAGHYGAIGPPGFCIEVDKNKAGRTDQIHTLYWRHHECCFFVPDTISTPVRHAASGVADTSGPIAAAQNANHVVAFSGAGKRPDHAQAQRRKLAHS